jgi:signal transduction histidine kinase
LHYLVVVTSQIAEATAAQASELPELRGDVGALIRSMDWSATSLGPLDAWPRSLKTMIGVMLNSRFPMMLGWGPDLLQLYNDAYVPVLGVKHPALGVPVRTVWSEIWDVVGPLLHSVLSGGPALWREHQLLFINSRGFSQETFHTFSQSPVPGDDGQVGGVLLTVQETTEQIHGERQLEVLRALAERSSNAASTTGVCAAAASVLDAADADIPFSLVYLLNGAATEARLALSSPAFLADKLAARVELGASIDGTWPFQEALRSGLPVRVDDLTTRFGALCGGRYGVAPEKAVVFPLFRDERDRYGFAVFGLSPWRAPSDGYVTFLGLVASQLVAAISRARAAEEERRRTEAMAELDRAKTLFFSNISHELRTPLTLLLGPTTDALSSPTGKLEGRDLDVVHRNALRLQKLVGSLLDFARIEAGRARASVEPVRLDVLTVDLASSFESAMRDAGLDYEIRCDELPEPVLIDPEMWEKIVLNLLSNALKFTFEGRVRISLFDRGNHIELEVADEGTGIPEDELSHVFDRFHRVQGARSRTQEGSGIGLALVQELARLLGGSASAKSQVGVGTTMTVVIPVRTADLSSQHLQPERMRPHHRMNLFVDEASRWLPNASPPTGVDEAPGSPALAEDTPHKARILVVDDNADMREYLTRVLARRWAVHTAVDGEAALASVRIRRPDVILTDVMMPNLDGFGLVARLRATEATADIPVVMLSARAGEESRIEGLDAGADDYLVKPFSARELIARVQVHLTLSHLRRQLLERALEARRAAEDATRAKDEFLAMLGHELRNPLSPIVMAVKLMQKRDAGSKELVIIDRQLKQLVRLVDDLLDVSRITRGKIDLHKERTSIVEVVRRAVETTQPLFEQRQQPIELDVPTELVVHGDPTRLEQVFANLLTNASKYSDPGMSVQISAKSLGGLVEIRVRDHGIGIRADLLDRVFDLFVQQPQSLDRAAGGLGLGLAIVKNLVIRHGGSVRVESAGPGTGSEFIVTLPAVGGSSDASNDTTAEVTTAATGPAHRILVVDDNEDGAEMLAHSLETMGHRVRVARDGTSALDIAMTFQPDFAFLDIGLPVMDGYELATRIMDLPGGRDIHLVALTGYGQERDRVASKAAGFVEHVVKPVGLERLRDILSRPRPSTKLGQ